MPVKIPDGLPASQVLANENIFLMTTERAASQEIRPLKIAILNLMPTKETTETQLLRMLSNTSLQLEITLLRTGSYMSRHTDSAYLETFYRTFEDVKDEKFDGLIVTGAPVEQMEFEDVSYWQELLNVMDWAEKNVFSTMFICWAAQAALYHSYGIKKHSIKSKAFGVFTHKVLNRKHVLMRGFDDEFYAPHSRHTTIYAEEVQKCDQVELLSVSEEAGVYIVASKDNSKVFVTGHGEYDALTLDAEYKRDLKAGLPIDIPKHYYPEDDASKTPVVKWRAHGTMLYANWLNYCVYQETPYDLEQLESEKERMRKNTAEDLK